MPYCFSRSSVKYQGHTGQKMQILTWIWCFHTIIKVELTNGYEMMHKAWSMLGEVPYCFARSSNKFQGHMGKKITDFDPNLMFPECNSSLNWSMAMKWCTKLDVVWKMCPIVFQGHLSYFKVTRDRKSSILTWMEHFWIVLQFEFTDGFEIINKAWCGLHEAP